MPLHEVQTKDPIVVFTYVGPLCPQSKHFLLWGKAARSLRSFKFFSSCFFFTEAIMDVCSASLPRTAQVYEKKLQGRGEVRASSHAIPSRQSLCVTNGCKLPFPQISEVIISPSFASYSMPSGRFYCENSIRSSATFEVFSLILGTYNLSYLLRVTP